MSHAFKELHAEKHLRSKMQSGLFGRLFSEKNLNGIDHKVTLREVWEKYKNFQLPTLSEAARVNKLSRMERFLGPIWEMKMCELTPQTISEYLVWAKENYIQTSSKKFSFTKETKDFRSVLSWYIEQFDYKYVNPIKPMHRKLGVIQECPTKTKKITLEEMRSFLSELPPMYYQMAVLQWFGAMRIGELAGIMKKNIDLEKRTLTVREVLIWVKGTPRVKSVPKNGEIREVFLNDTMLSIIRQRLRECPSNTEHLFTVKGLPIRYSLIAWHYNQAWKKAGLEKFSGTHLVRYSSSQTIRSLTGSLDSVMSITGHKSSSLANHYSAPALQNANRENVLKMEEAFRGQSADSEGASLNLRIPAAA